MKHVVNSAPLLAAPKVSVLMAVYNSAKYLRRAINSVLNQSFSDFELIIVDDGSTDHSAKIAAEFARKDQRIRFYSGLRRGLIGTRIFLLEQARGKYLAIMDSDDVSLPARLQMQVNYLDTTPQCLCVGGAYHIIDAHSRYLTTLRMPESDQEAQQLALAGHTTINQPCAMMRAEAVRRVGGYDPDIALCEDLDLWLRLGEHGEICNLHEPVLEYRVHDSSISETQQEKAIEWKRVICEAANQRRGTNVTFTATDTWRPTASRHSRFQFTMKYGWWAFNSDHPNTAMHYAVRAILLLPAHSDGWRLLAVSLRSQVFNLTRLFRFQFRAH